MGAGASEPSVERCRVVCVEACPELAPSSFVLERRPRPRQYLVAAKEAEAPGSGGASPLLETVGARFGWLRGADAQATKSPDRATGSKAGEANAPQSPTGNKGPAVFKPEEELQQGAVRGDLTKVKRALERRAAVGSPNVRGVTPLMLAGSSNGKEALEALKLLLEKQADMETRDNNGWRCIHHACRNGRAEVVRHLLDAKAEPAPMTTDHRTTLMLAVLDGKLELIKELMKLKEVRAQVVAKDALSVSAMHCVAKEGSAEVAKLLIENNGRANVVDIEGRTPLAWACQHGKLECAKALVRASGDIHQRDKTERTPLWHACMNASEGVALWLLKKFADPSMQDVAGDSPMMLADELGLRRFKKAVEVGTQDEEDA